MRQTLFFCLIVGLLWGAHASIRQSDLTSMTFGESTMDLVATMTQKSINSIVNSFLLETNNHDELAFVFQYDAGTGAFKAVPKDEAMVTLGCDPFEIPDEANADSNTCAANLLANTMNFGIRAVHGVPSQISGEESFKSFQSILLDVQYSAVTYNLITSEFQTFELVPNYSTGIVSVSAVSQDAYLSENGENEPFSFPFDLDITVREERAVGNLDKLPEATRNMIEGNLTQFYSIQTPTVPLNDGSLRNVPDIPGISEASPLRTYLKPFMEEFITVQDPTDLGIGLGMFVLADRYPREQSYEIPTRMQISTSPALDADQKKSSDLDAYTLTFQMVTEDNDLVTPRSFPWNWVNIGNEKRVQATMAVRRGLLVDYLKDLLSPELDKLCFGPQSLVDKDGNVVWKLGACADAPNFQVLDDIEYGKVLTYNQPSSEISSSSDKDGTVSTYLDSHLQSSVVFLSESTISIKSQLKVTGSIATKKASSGPVPLVNKLIQRDYVIGVDNTGGITVTLSPIKEPRNRKAANFSRPTPGAFKGLVTPEQANTLISSIYDGLPSLSSFMVDYSGQIAARLNSVRNFVFAEKCKMNNILFSDTLDIVSQMDILSDAPVPIRTTTKKTSSKTISQQKFKVSKSSKPTKSSKIKSEKNDASCKPCAEKAKAAGKKARSTESAYKVRDVKPDKTKMKTRVCGTHHMDLCKLKHV